jgi:hypothetical protein
MSRAGGLLGGGGSNSDLVFLPSEFAEVERLKSGQIAELPPKLREGRVARLTKAREKTPALAWCTRCTRVYAGDNPVGGIFSGLADAFGGNAHRCTVFVFPGHEGLCTDCACAAGATIPCLITGELFVPTPDASVEGFGHSLVVPHLAAILKQGGLIESDRSVRSLTPPEAQAKQAVSEAKRLFKECPVDVKPRAFFLQTPKPYWAIGHYARFRAEAVGLESAAGGFDSSGVYYARLDEQVFQVKQLEGRVEIDMSVDPEHFSVERANAIGGAATGALSGGLNRASWGAHQWGGGGAVAAGAAAGALSGLMAARAEQKAADEARDAAIRAHTDSTLKTVGDILKSVLMQQSPPLLAEPAHIPKYHQLAKWPDGVNVGAAAAAQLAKHPYSG